MSDQPKIVLPIPLVHLMCLEGLSVSWAEARRRIDQGTVKVNGKIVKAVDRKIDMMDVGPMVTSSVVLTVGKVTKPVLLQESQKKDEENDDESDL